jgi:hypothetical protein
MIWQLRAPTVACAILALAAVQGGAQTAGLTDTAIVRRGDTVWFHWEGVSSVAVRRGDTVSLHVKSERGISPAQRGGVENVREWLMDSTGSFARLLAYTDSTGARHIVTKDTSPPNVQRMVARMIAELFTDFGGWPPSRPPHG